MKIIKTRRIICLLMALSFLFLFSCNNSNNSGSLDDSDNPENSQGENSDEEQQANETAEDPLYIADLPEKNYNGEKFKMLSFTNLDTAHLDLVVEEQTGEVVNDAIYLSNRLVQDRFNIEFEEILTADYNSIPGLVKNTVTAGDNAYDYVMIADRHAMNLAMEGKYFYNMKELPYVNLDKLYWDQSAKTDMSIGNVLYFTYGANMLSSYDFVCFLVFNKQMVSDLGLESIYELVHSGKWTIDKMYEMAAAATLDINGDGNMNKDDRYGVLGSPNFYYPSFWGAERIPIIAKDESDTPYFNVPGNERLFSIFEKLYDYAQSGVELSEWGSPTDAYRMFTAGLGLFSNATMFTVQYLREMEVDYGIVPYPSLNEKNPGDAYSARLCTGLPIVVPVTSDAERASVIMEALVCEYQKRVIPNYYDLAVQTKSTRDEESVEMLDMLLANRFTDLGDTVWLDVGRAQYEGLFANKQNTFQSATEKIENKVATTLEKAIAAFQAAGE